MRLARHQELVELRRLDVGAGEHGVRLAAVVHLVLQQVGDDMAAALALDAAVAALEGDDVVERRFVQRADVLDEAGIGGRLGARELGHGRGLRCVAPLPLHVALAVQGGEVVEIDGKDVLERRLQAREKARPRRGVGLGGKPPHRVVQAMVGEPVGVDLRAQEAQKIHGRLRRTPARTGRARASARSARAGRCPRTARRRRRRTARRTRRARSRRRTPASASPSRRDRSRRLRLAGVEAESAASIFRLAASERSTPRVK